MIPLSTSSKLRAYITTGLISCSFAALVIYLVIIGGNKDALPFMTFTNTDFNFHVYCPVDTPTAAGYYKNVFGGNYINFNSLNSSSLYVVYVQSANVTTSVFNTTTNTYQDTNDLGLYYCGLARAWNETCLNSKLVCSAPGPMLYLPVDEQVTIMWINNITSDGIAWTQSDCYGPDSDDMDCMIDAKIPNHNMPQTEGCTFNQPTNYSFSSRKVRVNKTQVPISPHIHGLETRPSFDGNPLSWFNNVGDRGVGYFSLNDSQYFYQFSQPDSFYSVPMNNQKLNMRIIKALNKQPAGNLFYHDHAMKSTKYNVAHGLSGLYILYNKTAEANLPQVTQQKFVLFSHSDDGDLRNMTTFVPPPASHHKKSMHSDVVYTLNNGKDTYNRNMTYRFRMLNAHYDNVYYNVTFAVYYNNVTLPNGTVVAQQISPWDINYPLTNQLTKINFTIIGTDSALFSNPVNNINQFDLGVAERVELLIKFGPENGIPSNIKNFYLITFDSNFGDYVIKYNFTLNQVVSKNKYADPVKTKPLPVSFTDLSTIPKTQVALNRMRPLLSRPLEKRFLINGHYMFNMGQTDNPKIGTVEDWYIVNNLFEPHPMHIHLVNFQIVQQYDLKITPQGCTLYQLDFFRFSNYSAFQDLSDSDLCFYLGNITLEESTTLYHFLDSYNPETKFTSTNIGKVSGLNVMDPISSAADIGKYAKDSSCSMNTIYKYICGNSTGSINGWYKRWKETALVRQFTVMVLRVRWASTNYDPAIKPYPFFAVPEDQLMEFPGFVYHCHILPHEDNEMMRPFMLTPSDKYIQTSKQANSYSGSNFLSTIQASSLSLNSITKLTSLPSTPMPAILNWYQKAKQINTFLSCPV